MFILNRILLEEISNQKREVLGISTNNNLKHINNKKINILKILLIILLTLFNKINQLNLILEENKQILFYSK